MRRCRVRRRGLLIPGLLLAVFLAGYVVFPAFKIVSAALTSERGFSPEHILSLVDPANSANIEAVANSVLVSILSVLLSGTLGLLLALVFTQIDFPYRRQLERLAVLPVALPPLVGVIAFLFAFGESGVLPRAFGGIFGGGHALPGLDGLPAILVVHVYSFNVYFFLFISDALRKVDGSMLEAAEGLGAGPWRIFRQIVLPHLRPALLGAGALTFMASMASFSAPYIFAGARRFLTLQILTTKLNGDTELASAQSILLAMLSIVFFVAFSLFSRETETLRTGKGVGRAGILRLSGRVSRSLVVVAVVILALEILPLAMIVVLAFAREGSWTTQILPVRYTLDNFALLFTDATAFEPLWNSLLMAFLTVLAAGSLGVAGAYVIERGGLRRWKVLVDLALTFPYAIPGTVVGMAMILAFNAPSVFSGGKVLVGTFWILPLAYLVRMYPLALRSTAAALSRVDPSVVEAAESLGARSWRRFRTILFPLVRPGAVAGSLLVAIAALGEFVSSILLYTYANRPISVETLAQLRSFNIGAAAAYSVILLVMVIGITTLAGKFSKANGAEAFSHS
jgi:iron(III) transport system permease protein